MPDDDVALASWTRGDTENACAAHWSADDVDRLYRAYGGDVLRLIRWKFRLNRATTDDLAQDAWEWIIRSLHRFDPAQQRGDLKAWLLTIATRAGTAEIVRRKQVHATLLPYGGDLAEVLTYRPSRLSGPEDAAVLADMLARLPERRRQAILLTAVAGWTGEEARQLMGLRHLQSVRTHVFRGRSHLREQIAN